MAVEAGLHVDYLPLAADALAWGEDVLGVAAFRGATEVAIPHGIPMAGIRMPVLGAHGVYEVWRTPEPLESGKHERIRYRHGRQLLFGCISAPETGGLQAATQQAYREVLGTLEHLRYPHLLRVWNYLPQINLEAGGSERYWQFNSGRRNALLASGRDAAGGTPAACALGSVEGSQLVVYFLASRTVPLLIENPRQVSAYEYPPQYGPKPAFSRASVLHEDSGATLFISGTASIVGHRTLHVGDVGAQTRETLVNIEALLEEANRAAAVAGFDLKSLAYKVYIRNSTDASIVRSQLYNALGADARIVYLQADICRQDLLVEIEATGKSTGG